MNLFASFKRGLGHSKNRFAVGLGLSTIFAAQLPLRGIAADAVGLGSNLTLIATADGSPAPTFQWRKDGNAIVGATSATLSFSAMTAADAGVYQVVATNSEGSAVSPEEIVVVDSTSTNVAPAILTQPTASQTVVAGGSVSFSVSASGTPTPTFQWQKNGVAISGATESSLNLSNLTTENSGTYLAVATNSAGTVASNPAVLTVTNSTTPPPPTNVAPTIQTQPSASQTALAGGTVNFTVSASGVPSPSYQWKKNGVAISGATETSLTLSFLTTSDAATYVVDVSNVAGSVTSSSAVLTVNAATPPPPPPPPPSTSTSIPIITSQPAATQTVVEGSSTSFAVVASGNPAPSYQWRKNGAKIAGATSATLTLTSVVAADAAAYTVIASNSVGSVASEKSVLIVQSAPKFTVQPATQAITIGSNTKFSVVVSAIPGASLQWHKNGSPIPGATSSVLLLSSTSLADVGTYRVSAENDFGTTVSQEAELVVATPPIMTTQPISQTVSAKSNVTLKAAASGSPAPSYQWKKNGAVINGATNASLDLKAVSRGDAGDYMVEARNAAGWVVSKKATLVVNNATGKGAKDEDIVEPAPGVDGDVAVSGLVNLSVRANAGTGADGLIVGFVINGSSSKSVLVRGVGPTLRDFGVVSALSDPQLSLYSGADMTASNDDWSANENAAQIAGTSVRVGAFSLADRTSDSALMATLVNGAYTVQLSGKGTSSGVALVEVYDAASSGSGQLVNLSVRAYVGGSEVPNVGFVVAGNTSRKVMIRAVGPALGAFGVTDSISDPQLELFRGSNRIDHNDNWGGSATLSSTFAQVGAFGFSDTASQDAVLMTTLEPGAYTVVVTGVNGSKGVGLVEVYDVP